MSIAMTMDIHRNLKSDERKTSKGVKESEKVVIIQHSIATHTYTLTCCIDQYNRRNCQCQ